MSDKRDKWLGLPFSWYFTEEYLALDKNNAICFLISFTARKLCSQKAGNKCSLNVPTDCPDYPLSSTLCTHMVVASGVQCLSRDQKPPPPLPLPLLWAEASSFETHSEKSSSMLRETSGSASGLYMGNAVKLPSSAFQGLLRCFPKLVDW